MSRPSFFIDTNLANQTSTPSNSSSPRSSLSDLPFPSPLPRSDFLSPDFNPSLYLSHVTQNRHQTLSDLRSELRLRSNSLSQELLDLVNSHYTDFLNLGTSLKGGEDRVQEVWGGLRGYVREVEGLRQVVGEREEEVRGAVEERRECRREIERGRGMVGWERGVRRLEEKLEVVQRGGKDGGRAEGSESEEEDEDESEEDDDEEEEADGYDATTRAGLTKLARRVQDYRLLEYQTEQIGNELPFVVAQRPRMVKCRNTLLLDLGNSLRSTGNDSRGRLKVLALYSSLDASKEAIQILKGMHDR